MMKLSGPNKGSITRLHLAIATARTGGKKLSIVGSSRFGRITCANLTPVTTSEGKNERTTKVYS